MTRVKLTCGRVGHGISQLPGEIIEVEDGEASRMISGGIAEPVREQTIETAALRPADNMAARKRR